MRVEPLEARRLLAADFGDAPDDQGVAGYFTLLTNGGARHEVPDEGGGPILGNLIDTEPDGQPTHLAHGDDANVTYPGVDDEDGVTFLTPLVPGQAAQIQVDTATGGMLDAWIDFDGNFSWMEGYDQIAGALFSVYPLNPGSNVLTILVPHTTTGYVGETYARFRISSQGGLSSRGWAEDGEVEDYLVEISPPPDPQWDFGDAPDDDGMTGYFTLLANDGARHEVSDEFNEPALGNLIDTEPDGQPTVGADGDDVNFDDEDGVEFLTPLIPGQTAEIRVDAFGHGVLDAWIDFDGNGNWVEPHDQIFASQPLHPGGNFLTINVPLTPFHGETYARFRISSEGGLTYRGPAPDGEVEDYVVPIQRLITVEVDTSDDVAGEIELIHPDGSREIVQMAGSTTVHAMFEGPLEGIAFDDDQNGRGEVETELVALDLTGQSSLGPLVLRVHPTLPAPGQIEEFDNVQPHWLDLPPFAEPGFMADSFFDVFFEIEIPDTGGIGTLHTGEATRLRSEITYKPAGPGDDYISQGTTDLLDATGQPTGLQLGPMTIRPVPEQQWDFADAPDDQGMPVGYHTLLENNGARHLFRENQPWPILGNIVDPEPNGQPTVAANGDDDNVFYPGVEDDEDGVTFLTPLFAGGTAQIDVFTATGGMLDAWIDFDGDGNWMGPNDQIANAYPLNPGHNTLDVNVPLVEPTQLTYARFRISDEGGLPYLGPAEEGEVEDYPVEIEPGLATIGDFVWEDLNGNGIQEANEPGMPEVEVNLYDSAGNLVANAWTGAGGYYSFDVSPGDYFLEFIPPPDFDFTLQDAGMDDTLDSDADPISGHTIVTTLDPGEVDLTWDAGLIRQPDEQWDFGDAFDRPDLAAYHTLLVNDGARHLVTGDAPYPVLGNAIDTEPDGQPTFPADGDDTNAVYPGVPDDEDGITFLTPLIPGQPADIRIDTVTGGSVDAWIDFDGDWDWTDSYDQIAGAHFVPAGGDVLTIMVPVSATGYVGDTYARFRISSQGGLPYLGEADDGEVEDYLVEVEPAPEEQWDFGDVPDDQGMAGYHTYLVNDGARHRVDPELPRPILGNAIDTEPDGQPTTLADGDDTNAVYPGVPDDEDGITFLTPLIPGQPADIRIDTVTGGSVDAWIDFDGDWDWTDSYDQIAGAHFVPAGGDVLTIMVPVSTTGYVGETYARFRISSQGGLPFRGPAEDGEVEDYRVQIVPEPAEVMDQRIFYGGSNYETFTGLNGAIATDKVALLPGETADFDNYSNYTAGLNGLIVDVANSAAILDVSDFAFEVGGGNPADTDPALWAAGPAPISVTPDLGNGAGGSDRYVLRWADNAIENEWLQVTVLPADNYVFYFGNAIAEVGDSAFPITDVFDQVAIRSNPAAPSPANVTNRYDVNRDFTVDVFDQLAARNNNTVIPFFLQLITAPGPAPAPLTGEGESLLPPSSVVESEAQPSQAALAIDAALSADNPTRAKFHSPTIFNGSSVLDKLARESRSGSSSSTVDSADGALIDALLEDWSN